MLRTIMYIETALLIAFVSDITQAQPSAKDVKEICSPILAASITSEVNITRSIFSTDVTKSWLCSKTFQSEEEASQSGIDVNAEFEGVRIGLLYSNNQQSRKTARTQMCSGNNSTSDQAYTLALTEVTKDPAAASSYSSCVANVMQSQKDLVCYFQATGPNANALTLNVIYRPAGARTGKFSGAPALNGAKVDSGRSIFDTLKDLQKRPFDAARAVTPFSAGIPVSRTNTTGGSFNMALDDGTQCQAQLAPLPAKVSIRIQPIGTALSRTEGRHSYHADQVRNCGSDNQNISFDEALADGVVALTQQNLMSQIDQPHSSNCGRNASLIRQVVRTTGESFRVTYNIVGCGYDFLKACKGRGWIDQYGFIRTRNIDPTKPLTASHTETREFPNGRIEVFQAGFKQGLEPDFVLTDYFFTAEVNVPEKSAPKGMRQFSLRGYTKNTTAPQAKYCEDWQDSNGNWVSVAAIVGDNGVVTIAQDNVSCESAKNRIGQIEQNIRGVSTEVQCAARWRQTEKRLPKVASKDLTPKQLFEAAGCR